MQQKFKALLSKFAHLFLEKFTTQEDLVPLTHLEQVLLYSDSWREEDLLHLAAEGNVQTFLSTNSKNFDDELLSALMIHNNPKEFLYNPLPYLFRGRPNALFLIFNRKEDKKNLISMLDNFMVQTNSKSVQDHARIIFEELFMNAVFDAPNEAQKLGLTIKRRSCDFTFACDQQKLIISCFDPYGSLDVLKLMTRIRDIRLNGTKDIINMNNRIGGAGIGCSLLYHYSTTLVAVVEKGAGTRVTCTIPLKVSQRAFWNLGKNLQVFDIKKPGGKNGK